MLITDPEYVAMTVADYAAVKAQPSTLPEFAFSARHHSLIPLDRYGPFWGEMPVPIGPQIPPMVSNPRRIHEPRVVDSREIEWNNLRPLTAEKRPIKETGLKLPYNSLEGMEHFIAKVEALKTLTDQQARDAASNRIIIESTRELATTIDTFRANGFTVISLSSSNDDENDDEMEAANIAGDDPLDFFDRDAEESMRRGRIPYSPDPETLAPLMRRIDWERWNAHNGPVWRFRLIDNGKGGISAICRDEWMEKYIKPNALAHFGMKCARGSGITTAAELDNRRAYAKHYGNRIDRIYGVRTGLQYPEQSMDDLSEPKEEERNGGENELGLHGGLDDIPNVHEAAFGYTRTTVQPQDAFDSYSFRSPVWDESQNGLPRTTGYVQWAIGYTPPDN